jgi:hypothetical protein
MQEGKIKHQWTFPTDIEKSIQFAADCRVKPGGLHL